MNDVIIIGGGVSGYTAGLYCGRAGLRVHILNGGSSQLMMTDRLENFPGYEGIGIKLLGEIENQANKFGAEISSITVGGVDFSGEEKLLWSENGQEFRSRAVIICTGASPKLLGLEGEGRLLGRGISTCAICDGFFFRDKTVGVVGGGDSACEEAIYLAKRSRQVYMFVRGGKMRASDILQNRVRNNAKITIKYNTEVGGLVGDTCLVAVEVVNNKDRSREMIVLEGLFYAIGLSPNSGIFEGQLELDGGGYIKTDGNNRTSISGVFAAGDVTDYRYKQAVIAAGDGARAALEVQGYLS